MRREIGFDCDQANIDLAIDVTFFPFLLSNVEKNKSSFHMTEELEPRSLVVGARLLQQ